MYVVFVNASMYLCVYVYVCANLSSLQLLLSLLTLHC